MKKNAVKNAAKEPSKKFVLPTEDSKVVQSATLDRQLKSFLIPVLRYASLKWKPRNLAIKEATPSRGMRKCAICSKIDHYEGYNVDHKEPVVAVLDGFIDWNNYIKRVFCPKEGFQIVCKKCHEIKTLEEDKNRVDRKITHIKVFDSKKNKLVRKKI